MELIRTSKSKNYKVVVLGNSTVGKTSLVTRMVRDTFSFSNCSTIGASFCCLNRDGYCFQMWDTAGQERFLSLIESYYRNAKIALLVYDVTDLDRGIERLNFYFDKLMAEDCRYIIIGNKSDLIDSSQKINIERRIKRELGQYELELAQQFDYIFTSALTADGIEHLVELMIDKTKMVEANEDENEVIKLYDTSSWWDYIPSRNNCNC